MEEGSFAWRFFYASLGIIETPRYNTRAVVEIREQAFSLNESAVMMTALNILPIH